MVNIAKLKLVSRGSALADIHVILDKIRAETAPELRPRNSRKAKLRGWAVAKAHCVS